MCSSSPETLRVGFRRGAIYEYRNVPRSVYEELRKAESVGKYFNMHIARGYRFKKMETLHEELHKEFIKEGEPGEEKII